MRFECYSFAELDKQLLYDILAHRQEVFILGRHDIYRDLDGFDQKALHLLARNEKGEIEGYVRLLPAGVHYDGYDEHCFGRLSVLEKARGKGLGSELVKRGIEILLKDSSCRQVRISAMAYLEDFYRTLGFERTSDIFDISGVPHVTMLYTKEK